MSRGIRFSVDTERTLEHLEEDLFASSRSRALPREKGKCAERRNAFACRSSRTRRFFLLRCYFLASSCTLTLSERWIVGFATRVRCATNAWCTCELHAVTPFAPYRATTTGHR